MIQEERRLLSNAIFIKKHQLSQKLKRKTNKVTECAQNFPSKTVTDSEAKRRNRYRLFSEAALVSPKSDKLSGIIDLGVYHQFIDNNQESIDDNNNNDNNTTFTNERSVAKMPRPGNDRFPELYDLHFDPYDTTEHSHHQRRRARSDPIPIKNRRQNEFDPCQMVQSPEMLWNSFHCGSPRPTPALIRHYPPVIDLSSSTFQLEHNNDAESSSSWTNIVHCTQDDCDDVFFLEKDSEDDSKHDSEHEQELYKHIITSIENIPGLLETVSDGRQSSFDVLDADDVDSKLENKVDSTNKENEDHDNEKPSALSNDNNQKNDDDDDDNVDREPTMAEIGAKLRRISIDFMDSQAAQLSGPTETPAGSSILCSMASRASFGQAVPFMLNKTKSFADEFVRFQLELIFITRRVFRRLFRSVLIGILNFTEKMLPHFQDDDELD